MALRFRAVDEIHAGPRWQALFEEYWPAYRQWFLREGDAARPTYAASRKALARHMPRFVETYETLVDLAGGGDLAARFLSLYCPTPYMAGCSQAIWTRDTPVLLRNYDYAPHLCDGVILRSGWTGRKVVAATDCLWGALDGVNEAGLAAALAFGGRKQVGEGFGVALVLRYVLETADCTAEAIALLRRIPVHMSYNISLVDATGDYATVMVAPDRDAIVRREAVSTNHQTGIEWPQHARMSQTVERHRHLSERMADPQETPAALSDRFLQAPLYRTSWGRQWGTLYTAVYEPQTGAVTYRWPGHDWRMSVNEFASGEYLAGYAEDRAA